MTAAEEPTRLAVVDDEAVARKRLVEAFARDGYVVEAYGDAEGFLARAAEAPFDVALLDWRLPGLDGLEALSRLKKLGTQAEAILVTGHGGLDTAIEAIKRGAFHFVAKPFKLAEIRSLVRAAADKAALARENRRLRQALREEVGLESMIGASASMREVFELIRKIAPVGCNVLIEGASGTGKALAARAIHRLSTRRDQAFVSFNCGAFAEELIASELFGHEKGAFTGANTIRQGRFEQADGGTLFLDEIGDMPLDVQTRLLRVLADGQFYRVGGYAPVKVDVRIIAATHQNLEQRVQEGKFREDLFHRLNVIRVHLPPLRERREDIPRLARHFLQVAARELGVEAKQLHPETDAALTRLAWPGNVRQLENTCRWLTVMAAGQEVLIQDLPAELFEATAPESSTGHALPDSWATLLAQWADRALRSGHQNLLSEAQPEMERTLLTTALRHTQGHKQEAARLLGWGRNTLTRKLKELGME